MAARILPARSREDGDLGALTPAERDYLARKAVQSWKSSDNYDAWKDAYHGLDGNPEAKQALARAAINGVATLVNVLPGMPLIGETSPSAAAVHNRPTPRIRVPNSSGRVLARFMIAIAPME